MENKVFNSDTWSLVIALYHTDAIPEGYYVEVFRLYAMEKSQQTIEKYSYTSYFEALISYNENVLDYDTKFKADPTMKVVRNGYYPAYRIQILLLDDERDEIAIAVPYETIKYNSNCHRLIIDYSPIYLRILRKSIRRINILRGQFVINYIDNPHWFAETNVDLMQEIKNIIIKDI